MRKITGIVFLFWILSSLGAYAQQKSTYVIVHGAWGGAWQFKRTAEALQQQGQTVYRPTMTGLGERHHLLNQDINLSTHIKDVVNTILFENLNEVILVGHSYGGMVVTGVADSIPERIKKIVYLDAIVPDNGHSALQSMGMNENKEGGGFQVQNGTVTPTWVRDTTKTPRDVPHPIQTFAQPLVLNRSEEIAKIPTTYIFTYETNRGGKEKDDFYKFYQKANARKWKIVELEASHNPQIDKLDDLVEILLKESN